MKRLTKANYAVCCRNLGHDEYVKTTYYQDFSSAQAARAALKRYWNVADIFAYECTINFVHNYCQIAAYMPQPKKKKSWNWQLAGSYKKKDSDYFDTKNEN